MSFSKTWASCIISASLFVGSIVCAEQASDWRLEILKENGIPADTASLEKTQKNDSVSEEVLNEKIKLLASEKFAEREQSQKDILLMGKDVLPLIHALPETDDPEVRMRLGRVLASLQADGRWNKDALVQRAVSSLLHERKNPRVANPEGDLYVELFNEAKPSIANGYRQLEFRAGNGMNGSVSEGVARFNGGHNGNGDQRLILRAKDFNNQREFPNTFRIESKIGGAGGGAGVYHVGISIGNVRALFHPGYSSGAFRFERVDNNVALVRNTDMGFNPPFNKLLLMSIDAKRLPQGDVSLDVTITGDGKAFHKSEIIKAADIGKLETIGLDRSGRPGGDAMFDDFIVDFGKP